MTLRNALKFARLPRRSQRRVANAWRVIFPRPQAIEALRQAIRACALDCVTYLEDPTG